MVPLLSSARILASTRIAQLSRHFTGHTSTHSIVSKMSFPETIQAVAIQTTGEQDVVEKLTLPFPKQGPQEILVKINYAGVNMIDNYFRKGLYPIKKFPQILGFEASGTIVGLPTDEKLINDVQFKKRGYKIGGKVAVLGLGVHAEYVAHSWNLVFPFPDQVSLETSAASLLHTLTTVTTMTEAYNVQKGDIIFIHTIAGGLGLSMTAYAKSRGATVIGSTSTPEKAELAKSYGADHVILYTKENIVERVLEITNGEGVHAVYDGVGKETFSSNFDFVRRKGTLVNIGNASGAVDPISPLKLAPKNLKLVRPSAPNYLVTPEEAWHYGQEVAQGLASGLFKPRIWSVLPFTTEAVRQAQTEIATPGGKLAGKILIKIADE